MKKNNIIKSIKENVIIDPSIYKKSTLIKNNIVLDDFISFIEKYSDSLVKPKGFFNMLSFNGKKKNLIKNIKELKQQNEKSKQNHDILNSKSIVKKSVNILKRKDFFDMKGWSNEYKLFMKGSVLMLINMELRTGKWTHFIVEIKFSYFDFQDGRYMIDDNYKYYDEACNMWCCDYHQDCCLPLKRKFDLNLIVEKISQSDVLESETSVNPISFKIFMESDIIQKVIKGAEMDQWLGFVKIMLIVITICIVILLFMNGYVLFGRR